MLAKQVQILTSGLTGPVVFSTESHACYCLDNYANENWKEALCGWFWVHLTPVGRASCGLFLKTKNLTTARWSLLLSTIMTCS